MKHAKLIIELERVFAGNPTENFEPGNKRMKIVSHDLLEEVEERAIGELLEESFIVFELRQYALLFYSLASNEMLELADEDIGKKLRLLLTNSTFCKNQRSYGIEGISDALNAICERYEHNIRQFYENQDFLDFQDFLLFSESKVLMLIGIYDDLEFIREVLTNICPTLDTVAELEKAIEFDVVAAYIKLPTLINYAYKFSERLSVARREEFDKDWSSVLLRHYTTMMLEYMKYGYCNDNFEFLAQDGDFDSRAAELKLNEVNFVEVEAPGCVLYPKLFPYFITEETAREIVFIARVAKITRFERHDDNNLKQLVELLDTMEISFENALEFDLAVQKLKTNLSVYIYVNLLAPHNIHQDTALFLQLALTENSAVFVNFISCAIQYISEPFRFAEETAYEQLMTRKKSFVEAELNQIFDLETGENFSCFKLKNVGNENQILADAKLARFYSKTENHYYFDLDAYYFEVERSAVLKGFGAYKQFGLLFDYMIYDYQWKNEPSALLLSPQLKCSFSRIMRNLMYIKYFNYIFIESTGELLALRRFYGALDKFRSENPHFMRFNQQNSSIGAEISTILRIFRLSNLLHVTFNNIEIELDIRIKECHEKFQSCQKLDFLALEAALIELASGTSQAVFLNEKPISLLMCHFFEEIIQFEQLLADSKPFFAAQARYGKADEKMLLFGERVDICHKKTKELCEQLAGILEFE